MNVKRVAWMGLALAGCALAACAPLCFSAGLPQAGSTAQNSVPAKLSPREIQVQRAEILMIDKRYDEAIRAYQALAKAEPKNPVYPNSIGIAYLDLGNYNQAIKNFQRAAKIDKKFASAVSNIGMIYYEKKNYDRAIKEYQLAVKIDPKQAATHANLGYAYYNSGKYDPAFAEFHKALEIDPHAFEHNQGAAGGTQLQDKSVTNHGLFFFLMAKEYAKDGDAPHCAANLRKALDEGYPNVAGAATLPEFQKVINDPLVQGVLALVPPADTASPAGSGSSTAAPPS